MTRHFLRDDDLTPAEQAAVLHDAGEQKRNRDRSRAVGGPGIALIFDKPTLRTQLSFTIAAHELGGYPVLVDGPMAGIGTRESIADCAKVLGRQVGAIVWRTTDQSRVQEMAAHAGVPVVNALTDQFHPCQILADLLTIGEHRGTLAGQVAAYVGDAANNMAHSYLLGFATAGLHLRIGGPNIADLDGDVVRRARNIAATTGGSVTLTDDPVSAVHGAGIVITDTWVSMGQEDESATRKGASSPFAPFAVTAQLMAQAAPRALVMHCLPAYRGYEISAEMLDGPQSVVFDQAENRLHVQKAVLAFLMKQR
ncbi:ornithine carbamoyltransferase [Dermatophilaceae bacterium Sec6.4]|nr:ornithine carbamoyltransferase [Actinomycetota bacterium]